MGKSVKAVIFGLGNYWDSVKLFVKDELNIVSYMDNHIKAGDRGYICRGSGLNWIH